MDNLNPQMQNPNVPPMTPPSTGGAMPSMPAKNKSMWLWIVVAVAVVVAGLAWWYISQMAVEPVAQQPKVNQEAREDTMINKDIQEADLGDLDMEFQAVDSDLNSL